MKSEQELLNELSYIESEISKREINSEVYDTMVLLNKRVTLGKKIQQAQWNRLGNGVKEKKRYSDLETTKAFFEKYPEDIKTKFLYKKEYINLIENAKELIAIENNIQPLLRVLITVLNSSDYLDVHENTCIASIFEQIELNNKDNMNALLSTYKLLLTIPFEVK